MGQSAEAPPKSGAPPSLVTKKPTVSGSSSDPYANYSTPASLGFVDTDANRLAAEQEQRAKEGTIGEWSVVMPSRRKPTDFVNTEELESSSSQARRLQNDPDMSSISFAYLKERSLPKEEDDYDKVEIKVRAPKVFKKDDPVAKAKRQAETQAAPGRSKASTGGTGGSMFKPVVAQEVEEETPEEQVERNQAAWDLIAPREEVKPKILTMPEVPVFKKRKVKAEGFSVPSAKRRAE